MQQGHYFLVNILAVLLSLSGGSETKSKFGWEVGWVGGMEKLRIQLPQRSTKLKLKLKLSFENQDDFELVSEPPDILDKTAEIFTRKY